MAQARADTARIAALPDLLPPPERVGLAEDEQKKNESTVTTEFGRLKSVPLTSTYLVARLVQHFWRASARLEPNGPAEVQFPTQPHKPLSLAGLVALTCNLERANELVHPL